MIFSMKENRKKRRKKKRGAIETTFTYFLKVDISTI